MTQTQAPAESRRVVVGGVHTHYLTLGEASSTRTPPLVLLHGTAIDSGPLSFGPSLATFARHHRLIVPDWPGYGRSATPDDPLTIPDYVHFLGRFLDALEVERAHLVGFSMGGAAALGFALEHPGRLERLVLVGSYGLDARVQVPLLPYLALKTPWLERPVWRALRRSQALTRLFLERVVFANPRAVTRELVAEVHRQLEPSGSERAFMDWLHGELRPYRYATSYARQLADVRVPTLLLHGARDLVIPASRARRAARRIPDARLEVLPRVGHWLPREASDVFQRKVLGFLGEPGG